jgi:hypothetical protein
VSLQNLNSIYVSNTIAAHNSSRFQIVQQTLQFSAGVYTNKTKNNTLVLNKTVFLSVAAFNQANIAHYKIYFKNFLCFIKHYEIDLLLYILHHDIKDLEVEVRELELLGIRVLTYPDELFWQIVSTKKTPVGVGKGLADYSGKVPSFSSFGGLVMLVPILEVLDLGFNVIYFDVDIGLVQDPIPFVTQGEADFVTSIEMRHCPEFVSVNKSDSLWDSMEPNTGIMHVRATAQGRRLFRAWLENIVHGNVMNDQRAFDRKLLGLSYRSDCNRNGQSQSEVSNPFRQPTYCFLSEALFQNGMIAVQCASRPAARDDWLVAMDMHGSVGPSAVTKGLSDARFPVAVHVNYVKAKSHELHVRGLWLLSDQHNESVCKQYKLTDTYYSTGLNWTSEIEMVVSRRENLFDSVSRNGTLLQRTGGKEVYLMDENKFLRQVPDKDTFEALFGEDWRIVKVVPTQTLERFKLGKPLNKIQ